LQQAQQAQQAQLAQLGAREVREAREGAEDLAQHQKFFSSARRRSHPEAQEAQEEELSAGSAA
jgi:hypothetical protein